MRLSPSLNAPKNYPTNEVIDELVDDLQTVVWHQACALSYQLNIRWSAVPDAPTSPEALRVAFEESLRTGVAFPVSSLYCEPTIYGPPACNWALRFWHDMLHVKYNLDFSLVGEALVAVAHLDGVRAQGFDEQSLVFRAIQADTLGQARCFAELGGFPKDQHLFVIEAVIVGIDSAIENEHLRRQGRLTA